MDDNGYLTGWYVFSTMGFYPVEPSKGVYVIGSPKFRKVKVSVHGPERDNGEFVIEARNASEENIYIQSATLNGKTLNRPHFHHSESDPRRPACPRQSQSGACFRDGAEAQQGVGSGSRSSTSVRNADPDGKAIGLRSHQNVVIEFKKNKGEKELPNSFMASDREIC